VWARRGLPLDATGVIDELRRLIPLYSDLLGPYAFDKYVIVFLPEFSGGEEHAGITFQSEFWGPDTQGAGDRAMIGHELGHQWFGDYMTVETWDDLWIKEGMASLLEAESNRAWEDRSGKGNLLGSFQWVDEGDAILDPELPADDKYTSGPYGRAAWLLTQLRALLGDELFFATLRQMLRDHAFGTISTAAFLDAFAPHLGHGVMTQVHVALQAKALPRLDTTVTEDGVTHLTLTDPDQALIVPLTLTRLGAEGEETVTLRPGVEHTIAADDARPTVFDVRDVHCAAVRAATEGTYAHLQAPLTRELLGDLPGVLQTSSLEADAPWDVTPAEYAQLKEELASEIAKAKALRKACATALAEPDEAKRAEWRRLIDQDLFALPLLGLHSWYGGADLTRCLAASTPGLFEATFARVKHGSSAFAARPVELEVLGSSFDLPAEKALDVWAPVATHGATLRLRVAATRTILNHFSGTDEMERSGLDVEAWKRLFRDLTAHNRTSELLRYAIGGLTATRDTESLPLLAEVVRTIDMARVKKQAVCAARTLTLDTDGAFQRFAEPLLQVASLPLSVRDALTNAAACGMSAESF
jgi:aminopeptidase N